MSENNHKVDVITSSKSCSDWDNYYLSKATIHRYPAVFRIKNSTVYFSMQSVGQLLTQYDVIHSFTFFTFSSSFFGLIARGRKKFIRSEAAILQESNLPSDSWPYSVLVKLYKKNFKIFTAYTDAESKILKSLGIPHDNILILPLMIDYEKFSTIHRQIEQNQISFGTIGRIATVKGIHRIADIFEYVFRKNIASLTEFNFTLAGEIIDTIYAKTVLSRFRKILGKKFEYMGEISPPDLFYSKIDVVIIPSIKETGAIAVLEAMSSGKVVIASNIYPINRYIQHGYNGFLFENVIEASTIIIRIINGDEADIQQIASRAKRTAKFFDYRLTCQLLEKAYLRADRI